SRAGESASLRDYHRGGHAKSAWLARNALSGGFFASIYCSRGFQREDDHEGADCVGIESAISHVGEPGQLQQRRWSSTHLTETRKCASGGGARSRHKPSR